MPHRQRNTPTLSGELVCRPGFLDALNRYCRSRETGNALQTVTATLFGCQASHLLHFGRENGRRVGAIRPFALPPCNTTLACKSESVFVPVTRDRALIQERRF